MTTYLRGIRTPPCIVCGQKLKDVFGGSPVYANQPGEGLAFTTHGHYGSTVFDPMDGSSLEINICDPCVEKAMERGDVLMWPTKEGSS